MKFFLSLIILFTSFTCLANTDLREKMASTCENLGSTEGEKCVVLQRRLEKENATLDQNGAEVCALIWKWGSRGGDVQKVGDLVLSCFNQVANRTVSTEVKETCNKNVYEDQGSIASMSTINLKVNRMMSCIGKLSRPVAMNRSGS